jgi:outer membrane protein OmpA-like peptidoglycan-associated protein
MWTKKKFLRLSVQGLVRASLGITMLFLTSPAAQGEDSTTVQKEVQKELEDTQVPEQDVPAACQTDDLECARWYYLNEKPKPDAWNADAPAFSKKQRWYHVGKTVVPPKPRIIVLEGVRFDFDKANLRPDAIPILERNLGELQSENVRVKVVGHTDERGTDAYNQDLSQRRAEAVMNYYIQRGIPAERLSAEGRGESEPIATNEPIDGSGDTAEENLFGDPGRAKNRRIELHIQDVNVSTQ